MNVRFKLISTSPLLMHNPRMADPQYEINRQIKTITSKRKKTDQDLQTIERLEWYGGLYTMTTNGTGSVCVCQPTSKLRKCLINTAKISKMSKTVERALSFTTLETPLIYDGPSDIDKLFEDERFTSRLSVGVQNKRVMRCRPKFPKWQMTIDGLFIEDAGLNFDQLQSLVELAGQVEGIGDNRVNGYGRFVGEVSEI